MPQRPDFGDLIRKVGLARDIVKSRIKCVAIEMLKDGDVCRWLRKIEGALMGDRLANSVYLNQRGVVFGDQ
jgi:hypothetical protein